MIPAPGDGRPNQAPLAVTLLAGWVGSGKSTLVGRLVDRAEESIAVVHAGAAPPGAERAWWCIPVEEELVFCSIDRCPCCAVRLDLVTVVGDLARRRARPDRVVIELSGHADVAAALQTFLRDPVLRRLTCVDAVVTVVDVPAAVALVDGSGHLGARAEVLDAIAVADRIVMSRRERVSESVADRLAWTLHAANRRARLSVMSDPKVDLQILGEHGFAPAGIEDDRRPLRPPRAPEGAPVLARVEVEGVLGRDALSEWMDDVHHHRGADLLRLHGVLAVEGEDARWIARGVRTTLDLDDGSVWSPGEARTNRVWLAGRGLDADALRDGLQRCVVA